MASLPPRPPGRTFLAERPDALAEVLAAERRQPQVDQRLLVFSGHSRKRRQPPDDLLVAPERQRRIRSNFAGELDRRLLDSIRLDDLVYEADTLCPFRLEVAPDEEELAGPSWADRVQELE